MAMKKLIPCNLVMVFFCLISILSLLFFPLLTVDLGKMVDSAMEDSGEDNGEVSALMSDAKFSMTTISLGEIAVSKDPKATFLTQYFLHKDGLVENVFLSAFATAALQNAGGTIGKDVDFEKLNDILSRLETSEDVLAVADDYVAALNEELVKAGAEPVDAEEYRQAIQEVYDKVKEHVSFTVESFVCLTISGFEENAPTTYPDLAKKISAGEISSSAEGESESVDAFLSAFFTIATVGSYLKYFFYGMLVLLLPWALFLILGLVHTFIENKRAMTWYVFTFGWIPCVVFWLMPTLAKFAAKKAMGAAAGMFAAIGSWTWISGICLVVMWFLWLFWMRPLKKEAKD